MKLSELQRIAAGQSNGDPLPGYGIRDTWKARNQLADHAVNKLPKLVEALRDVKQYLDAIVEMNPNKNYGTEGARIRSVVESELADAEEVEGI